MPSRSLAALFMALLILAPGRETAARPPRTVQDKPLTGAGDPVEVLAIMERACRERDAWEFRKVLADSFLYRADLATLSAHPRIRWDHYGIAEETRFLDLVLNPARSVELTLRKGILRRGTHHRNRAEYEIRYDILFDGTAYGGEATFRFVETNNRWYLWQWLESVPVSDSSSGSPLATAGELRGLLLR